MTSLCRVLVTGGTGFVGQSMAGMCPKGMKAFYISHYVYDNAEWDMEKYWDYIVHLAPVSPDRVLKYALKHNAKILYCSSGAVYEGTTGYAFDKRLWETECTRSGVDLVIARLFTFIGKGLKNKYAITKFIEAARKGKPLEVWGDGSSIRSYLYGEDLGRWMWQLLLSGKGAYDVGSVVPYTTLEVARMVADIIPAQVKVLNCGEPPTVYLPDTSRAEDLGCRETVGLREAIERVANESN